MKQLVYTIQEPDVGKILTVQTGGRVLEISDVIGRIQALDVGKQVFEIGGILQVENSKQRERRFEENSS